MMWRGTVFSGVMHGTLFAVLFVRADTIVASAWMLSSELRVKFILTHSHPRECGHLVQYFLMRPSSVAGIAP